MKNILVPIGSNDNAVGNLQYAIDLAYHWDAYVYVFSAFRELSKVGGLAKVNAIIKEDCENRLQEVLDKVDKKGVTVIDHPVKGSVLETVVRFNKHVSIDLMVLSPKSNSIREEVYLGKTTGNLVKNTNIPALIVPEGDVFKGPETILMAFKDGNFKHKSMLEPLKKFMVHFGSEIKLLHVSTPESTPQMQRVPRNWRRSTATNCQRVPTNAKALPPSSRESGSMPGNLLYLTENGLNRGAKSCSTKIWAPIQC